jgi:hypothetical protein
LILKGFNRFSRTQGVSLWKKKKINVSKVKTQIGVVQRVPITSIKENPLNFEIYSSKRSKEDEELEQSIRLYGQLEPCIVNIKNNQLISGHRRFNSLKRMGIETIDVIFKEVDELEILELIQSNKQREKTVVEKVNEYRFLKSHMKSLPLKKRKELMSGMKLRNYLHKETGVGQVYTDRFTFIEMNGDNDLLEDVLIGKISIEQAYNQLKNQIDPTSKKIKSKKIKSVIKEYMKDFSIVEVYRIVDEVYKKSE